MLYQYIHCKFDTHKTSHSLFNLSVKVYKDLFLKLGGKKISSVIEKALEAAECQNFLKTALGVAIVYSSWKILKQVLLACVSVKDFDFYTLLTSFQEEDTKSKYLVKMNFIYLIILFLRAIAVVVTYLKRFTFVISLFRFRSQ